MSTVISLAEAISRCTGKSQNTSHIYFLIFFPTLWLFSAQELPVFNGLWGISLWWVPSLPLNPCKHSAAHKAPWWGIPKSMSVQNCILPSLSKPHKRLMMPPNSHSFIRQLHFLREHSPETTPGTADLHCLLIWGEIRHSWLPRIQVVPVRWAFLSKKLTLC